MKRFENEYEAARREAMERMKAEEERRQLEGKLQAEALRQQMEELKQKEMEVRGAAQARVGWTRLKAVLRWQQGWGSVHGPHSRAGCSPLVCASRLCCGPPWRAQTLGH